MNLKEQLNKDIIQAMKDKDTLKKDLLNNVKSNIINLEIEKKSEITRKEELEIIQREVKQIKESLWFSEQNNRKDLITYNRCKLDILNQYLPKQLSENEVREELKSIGLHSGMNMGQAMGQAMKHLNGQADNKTISIIVKDIIK